MLVLWSLAALSVLLGLIARPDEAQEAVDAELLSLLRVISTTALALVLVLGPGIALREMTGRKGVSLGFLPIPGIALLVAVGCCAWLLAGPIGSAKVCVAALGPVLVLLLIALLRAGPEGMLAPGERRALLVVGSLLGLAVARSLWFLGPEGELFAGGISRTFEVGSRPDSRIPFHVVQLVAHGTHPYSELGSSYFSPYNFSSRGPLAGIADAPIVLLAGGRPPTGIPELAWKPFDPSGFMAFRLAMMTLSCTALLSLWTLVKRLAGERGAHFAVLLAATTPFLLHEAWFTWPKLLAASFVLLATVSLIDRRALLAGVLVGIGYLMHPVALLAIPALSLLALWPLIDRQWRKPQVRRLLELLVGTGVFFLFWRFVNGSHYSQDSFFDYLTEAGPGVHATPWGDTGAWLSHRLESLGNTVVPMMLSLAHGDNPSINTFGGSSPPVVHIFFQYWNTLPFGVGIVFFPLLLVSLWKAWRRWPWPVLLAVVVPFLTFLVYWGSYSTGLLPEGLQAWVLMVLAVVAIQQAYAGFPWLQSRPIKALLTLRVAELLAVAVVPTWATRGELLSAQYKLCDSLALLLILGFCGLLAGQLWFTRIPLGPAQNDRDEADQGDGRQHRGETGVGSVGRGFESRHV
jgi:hypothetical protein